MEGHKWECLTPREKLERQEFLARRKSGIGGSDVAAIMGLSKWKTPYDVWKDKTSDEIHDELNDILELASYLEDYTARKYAALKGYKVQRKNAEIVNADFPYLKGNIDREILLDGERGVGILECKALSTFNFRRLEMYGLPPEYICQIQHYFLCSNGRYHWAAFAILNRDNGKMLTFEVVPDLELMQEIKNICSDFWLNCVLANVPPSNTLNASEKAAAIPKFDGTISDLSGDSELAELISQRNENDSLVKEATALRDETDERIKEHLGDIEAAECGGARIYYRSSSRTSLDSARLKKEKPEIYNEYSKTTEGARSLRFYKLEA